MGFCGKNLRAISQKKLQNSIHNMNSKITLSKTVPHLSQANESNHVLTQEGQANSFIMGMLKAVVLAALNVSKEGQANSFIMGMLKAVVLAALNVSKEDKSASMTIIQFQWEKCQWLYFLCKVACVHNKCEMKESPITHKFEEVNMIDIHQIFTTMGYSY